MYWVTIVTPFQILEKISVQDSHLWIRVSLLTIIIRHHVRVPPVPRVVTMTTMFQMENSALSVLSRSRVLESICLTVQRGMAGITFSIYLSRPVQRKQAAKNGSAHIVEGSEAAGYSSKTEYYLQTPC